MSDLKIPWEPPDDREFDVIGLGCAAMDIVARVPNIPSQNEKIHALEMERSGGGPVATALVVVSRLGFKASFIGQVGDDFAGRFVLNQFRKEGVAVIHEVVHRETRSQISMVLVDEKTGDRTIVSGRGELAPAGPTDLRINAVKFGSILHVDGYDMKAAIAAAKIAQREGIVVVYDCGSVKDGTIELLRNTDIAVVSKKFARQLADTADYERVCLMLREHGPEYVGVTLGRRGVYAMDDYSFFHVPAFDVTVIDTTGAGDVFHGAIDVGLLLGLGFREILILASAVSALKCGELGGRAGIPDLPVLKTFLNDNGYDFL
jgi:ribokinase